MCSWLFAAILRYGHNLYGRLLHKYRVQRYFPHITCCFDMDLISFGCFRIMPLHGLFVLIEVTKAEIETMNQF